MTQHEDPDADAAPPPGWGSMDEALDEPSPEGPPVQPVSTLSPPSPPPRPKLLAPTKAPGRPLPSGPLPSSGPPSSGPPFSYGLPLSSNPPIPAGLPSSGRRPVSAGVALAPGPLTDGSNRAPNSTDVVTCPECGQLATVDMARRQADDFCRKCDFPLFWARGTVIAPQGAESGASLRRLPGTVGRAATAALICPHCAEPNSPAAEICVRCALSLHPVDIPEPEPVVIVEPEPEPEPEPAPSRGFDWWWIVALIVVIMAIGLVVAIVVLQ